MTITDLPHCDRPREKLISKGPGALSDAELLAIFLRTGFHGVDALTLARDLLLKFGGLRGLLDATRDEVCSARGIGEAKYAALIAARELTERYLLHEIERGEALLDPATTGRYLKIRLRHYAQEVFGCLFLDNQHRVIKFEELFSGTIDGASVYPREVVRRALYSNAAAVIFAHNHPSGLAEPSQADIRITERLKSALLLVDIRVLDHVIIGDGAVMSFADRGLL